MNPLNQRALLRNPRIVPAVLALGLALSLLGALVTWQFQTRHARARMDVEATIAQENLLYTIQAYRDILLGFRGHAATRPGRESFHEYFEALDLETHHPGLLAVSYSEEVAARDLPAFEARQRIALRDPGFKVRPAGEGESCFVLLYSEPGAGSPGAAGIDTRGLPGQAESIDLARDTGTLVVTGPMRVLQHEGPDPGLLLRLPFYRGAPRTLEERRSLFAGCITAVFRVQDLVAEALGNETMKKMDVLIEDAGPSQGGPAGPPRLLFGGALAPRGIRAERTLDMFGRSWHLQIRARPEWGGHPWALSISVGAAGCLITLLLWGLMLSLGYLGQRARLLALRMMDQLREEESRLEAMTLAVPDPLAILDEDGRFLHLYGQHESILGRGRGALLGATVDQALPGPAANALMAGVGKALETRRLQTAGFELTTPTGRLDFEARMLRMEERIDGRRCVVLSIRDITERTRAEEAAREKQKLESLGVLAGGIAHDFNNFLTAILGHVNLAQEWAGRDSRIAPTLQRAETSILRAAELAHQMLAYSGRGSLKVDFLDLNRVVEEMTELLSVSITKKAALEIRLEPGLPRIMADAVQIQQVVMNLVTNASEALGDRSGTITIQTRILEADRACLAERFPDQALEPGTYAQLTVADTGCGMDTQTRKRIFDPFFTTKSAGRGLGLSATLGILKGHLAGIHIQSEAGRGSRFEIIFPSAGLPQPLPGEPAREDGQDAPIRGIALVADDEHMVRSVMVGILENRGMQVLEAADGQEALEIFTGFEGHIDVVLLDITMPRMDGNEAYRAIRARDPEVPVILLSGFSRQNVAQPPPGMTAATFVQKPFRIPDLEQAVRRALEGHHGT